jgi:hypothetical protein
MDQRADATTSDGGGAVHGGGPVDGGGAVGGGGHGGGSDAVTPLDPQDVAALRTASGLAAAGVLLLLLHLHVGPVDLLNDIVGAWLLLAAIARLPTPGARSGAERGATGDRAAHRRLARSGLGLLAAVVLVEVSVWAGRTAPAGGVQAGTTAAATPDVLVGVAATLLTLAVLLGLAAHIEQLTAGVATLTRSWMTTRMLLRWALTPALGLFAAGSVVSLAVRGTVGGGVELEGPFAVVLVVPLLAAVLVPQLHLCLSLWRTRRAVTPVTPVTPVAPAGAGR